MDVFAGTDRASCLADGSSAGLISGCGDIDSPTIGGGLQPIRSRFCHANLSVWHEQTIRRTRWITSTFCQASRWNGMQKVSRGKSGPGVRQPSRCWLLAPPKLNALHSGGMAIKSWDFWVGTVAGGRRPTGGQPWTNRHRPSQCSWAI